MILNFRLYYFLVQTTVILYVLIYLMSVKISLTTNFFDLITNVYINDFYLNNFYFIWTQFFILPTFLILIYYKHTVITFKCKNHLIVLVTYFSLILLTWWVVEYYWINQYIFSTKNTQYFFNNLLNNPLNKYHPLLFFTSYLFIYNLTSYISKLANYKDLTQYKYTKNFYINCLVTKVAVFWVLMSVSLYLGAWWALQEGSWGGWWNWDASEVFGLLILTYLILILHFKVLLPQTFKLMFLLGINMTTLVVYYVLQMSYNIVSHNFGLSLLGYGYTNLIFIFITTTLVYLYFTMLYKLYNFFLTNSLLKYNLITYFKLNNGTYVINPTRIIIVLFTLSVSYLYLISFNPIFNNIFWKSFNLEVLNKWFSWLNVKLFIILVLLILVIKINTITLLTTIISSFHYFMYTVPIIFHWSVNYSFVKLLHTLLIVSLTLPLLLQYILYTEWEVITTSFIDWCGYYTRLVVRGNVSTDNTYIVNTLYESNLTSLQPITSFFWFHNNLDTQFFLLDLTDTSLQQSIHNHTYLYLFKVNIYDNPSLTTDLFTIIILLTYLKIYNLNLKIIF